MNEVIAGIDIGGTKIAIALENSDGERIAGCRLPTNPSGTIAIEEVLLALSKLLAEHAAELVAIGIGCPSPLDVENGLVMSPSNLPGWDNLPIVEIVGRRFGVPVAFDNDANAAALGEYVYGAGRGYKNVVYITVSTGVGGGLIIGGEIFRGAAAAAGEIGHMIVQPGGVVCNCGASGCLETICSGVHIARRARERLAAGGPSIMTEIEPEIEKTSAKTVAEAAQRGDRLACEVWDETCRFLAVGVGNVVTLLAPEVVIIGGGVASAGDLLFGPLRRLVPMSVSMVPAELIKILPAALGPESGVCGAIALAKKVRPVSVLRYG